MPCVNFTKILKKREMTCDILQFLKFFLHQIKVGTLHQICEQGISYLEQNRGGVPLVSYEHNNHVGVGMLPCVL